MVSYNINDFQMNPYPTIVSLCLLRTKAKTVIITEEPATQASTAMAITPMPAQHTITIPIKIREDTNSPKEDTTRATAMKESIITSTDAKVATTTMVMAEEDTGIIKEIAMA